MDIEYLENDFGVANTYKTETGFRIELNHHLNEFPELRRKILEHEREHALEKTWIGQRRIDALTEITFKDLFPFYKRHPKAFVQQHLPFNYNNGTLFIEWSLIVLYTIYLSIIALSIFLIKTFSKDSQFFWLVIKYTIMILLIVVCIYYSGKWLRKYINEQAEKSVTQK